MSGAGADMSRERADMSGGASDMSGEGADRSTGEFDMSAGLADRPGGVGYMSGRFADMSGRLGYLSGSNDCRSRGSPGGTRSEVRGQRAEVGRAAAHCVVGLVVERDSSSVRHWADSWGRWVWSQTSIRPERISRRRGLVG